MKRISIFHILCILSALGGGLASCAPALPAITPVPSPTASPAPTRTHTPAPTATITLTPTPELPTLPPEYSSVLPANYKIENNRVMVGDEVWFELNAEKQWQKTDWKLFEDADMQTSWQPEKDWHTDSDGTAIYGWPIVTGESAVEKKMMLNGKEMTVTLLPVIIKDMQDPSIIRHVFVPLRYTDKNGQVVLETWYGSGTSDENVELKTIEDLLLKAERGLQLELKMSIFTSSQGRITCNNIIRCQMTTSLIDAQELDLKNKVVKEGDVLPSSLISNYFKVGQMYGYQ